jgi:hypothetical protein
MDCLLPDYFLQSLQNVFYILAIIALCLMSTPYFVIIVVPLVYFFKWYTDYFFKSSLELKRLESIRYNFMAPYHHHLVRLFLTSILIRWQSISHVLILRWEYSRPVYHQVLWFLRYLQCQLTVIFRAYGKQESFIENFFRLTDAETRNFFCYLFTSRWLALRLDMIALSVIFVVGLLGK